MVSKRLTNKRLIQITQGNLGNSSISIADNKDLFPLNAVGASAKPKGRGKQIEVYLIDLNIAFSTDIPIRNETGKPRWIIRDRKFLRKFYAAQHIQEGDIVEIERLSEYRYVLRALRDAHSAPATLHKPRAAEFFAGIGLVRLALEKGGWQVVFANDIDPDKAVMYRANFGDRDFHLGDIYDLKLSQIPQCELFSASFPCNDLSIAGAWQGLNGKRSSTFWGFVDILKKLGHRRPPILLIENVIGFLQSHGGKDLESALLALNSLGYAVDAFILNAVHWVPQSRARLFVVAKPHLGKKEAKLTLESDVRPEKLCSFIIQHQHINWDLRDLPKLPKPQRELHQIVEDLPDTDTRWWNEQRTQYFFNQLSVRHRRDAEKMIQGRAYSYATAFRRVRYGRSMAELRTDGIAGCLRTPRGGSGRQILFKAGRGKYMVRLLTPRECARLQGASDSFVIEAPTNKALFGFGDAVCVPAIEWIVDNYLTPLLRTLPNPTSLRRLSG